MGRGSPKSGSLAVPARVDTTEEGEKERGRKQLTQRPCP